jgi:hypothetical protein
LNQFPCDSNFHNELLLLAFPPNSGAVLAVTSHLSLLQGAIVRAGFQALPILKTALDLGFDLLLLCRISGESCGDRNHKNQQGQQNQHFLHHNFPLRFKILAPGLKTLSGALML